MLADACNSPMPAGRRRSRKMVGNLKVSSSRTGAAFTKIESQSDRVSFGKLLLAGYVCSSKSTWDPYEISYVRDDAGRSKEDAAHTSILRCVHWHSFVGCFDNINFLYFVRLPLSLPTGRNQWLPRAVVLVRSNIKLRLWAPNFTKL